jgi:hypothetical protein
MSYIELGAMRNIIKICLYPLWVLLTNMSSLTNHVGHGGTPEGLPKFWQD